MIKGLGIKRYSKLIEIFKSNKNIYNATRSDLREISLIDEKMQNRLLDTNTKKIAKLHLKYMIKNNIDIIFIGDNEYPRSLLNIYNPPLALYIRGNKQVLNEKNISMVGCRQCSNYGKEVALKIAYKLSKEKINIVSGLAKGIDMYSHIGTLNAKGKTVAVFGNGLDTVYPKENMNLAINIINNNGAVISEFPLGIKPEKNNFPLRNRIISGLGESLVVVEAEKKSGTLITVDFALDQGKDIFVVPGNITSRCSIGTNELIKQGAKIITSVDDILCEIL